MQSLFKLFVIGLLISVIPINSQAEDCATTTDNTLALNNFDLTLNYFSIASNFYNVQFQYLGVIDNQHTWSLTSANTVSPSEGCSALGTLAGNTVYLDRLEVPNTNLRYSVRMALKIVNNEYRLALIDFTSLAADGENQAPTASSLSRQANNSVLYQVVDLIANDQNGDALTYELVSSTTGSGYDSAYINPQVPRLYITLKDDFSGEVIIQYRATDGMVFSNTATITLSVGAGTESRSLGLQDIPPETYAGFNFSAPNANLFGAPGADASLPGSIDLSDNFPIPGDQGTQSSCVGWASAYALKSYHEKVEMNWSLNTPEHLFSPGFIYNQINSGQDRGSLPSDAFDLIVNSGVSSWASMPYDVNNPFAQPSAAAKTEAAKFKAASWAAVRGVQDMKATLANRNPVLIGIQTYNQLMQLRGPDSVFNDYSGNALGGHAVTVVGYDDNKYGGAFKVINSWGTSWGDGGYFWLPYNTSVLMVSMSLTDANNSNVTTDPVNEQTEPPPSGNLPNLTVSDWNINYDNRPGGSGSLTYKVSNTGSATAPAGAYVNLMLSTDAQFNSNDTFIIYEQIPFDLPSGQFAFRDNSAPINFNFPTNLAAGQYFMALWVDDLNTITESNEDDNISVGQNTIRFQNDLADLSIESWYAEVLDLFGNSGLIYTVRNIGASTAANGWDLNLVLSNDPIIGNGDERWLVYETVPFDLIPGDAVFRDEFTFLNFNIFSDINGNAIPAGNYYMAFWVDDTQVIAESNENNNFSLYNGLIPINSRSGDKTGDNNIKAYNGRVLPDTAKIQKIEIRQAKNGKTVMRKIGKSDKQLPLPKRLSAFDKVIFPLTQGHNMESADLTEQ